MKTELHTRLRSVRINIENTASDLDELAFAARVMGNEKLAANISAMSSDLKRDSLEIAEVVHEHCNAMYQEAVDGSNRMLAACLAGVTVGESHQ